MSKLFNSVYEVSLRILIQLLVLGGKEHTSDYISCLDYLSLYSKTFEVGNYDLHGKNPYRFSELASRLMLGKRALKALVARGFVTVSGTNQGFVYAITDKGKKVSESLKLNYAMSYMDSAIDVQEFFKDYSDEEILKYISRITQERTN